MAVSKRLRYEILRRDDHTCRYCGAAAPDVRLTVDHVVPTALGGSDEPDNLVTACADCNTGKSASAPDAPLVTDVQADAIRWSKAMTKAAEDMLADYEKREELRAQFLARWEEWKFRDGNTLPLPTGWQQSIDQLINAGLPLPVLLECIDIAMGNTKVRTDNIFRYMCGVAWNRVQELHKAARETVADKQDQDLNGEDTDSVLLAYREVVSQLFTVLGKEYRDQLWTEEDLQLVPTDPNEACIWMLQTLTTRMAIEYLNDGLSLHEAEVWVWMESFEEPIDLRAVKAAMDARKWKEQGVIEPGRCMCVVDGLPCPSADEYLFWLANCNFCDTDSCRGHRGLCEQHLEEMITNGLRDPDGEIIGVVTDYQVIPESDEGAD